MPGLGDLGKLRAKRSAPTRACLSRAPAPNTLSRSMRALRLAALSAGCACACACGCGRGCGGGCGCGCKAPPPVPPLGPPPPTPTPTPLNARRGSAPKSGRLRLSSAGSCSYGAGSCGGCSCGGCGTRETLLLSLLRCGAPDDGLGGVSPQPQPRAHVRRVLLARARRGATRRGAALFRPGVRVRWPLVRRAGYDDVPR